MMSLETNHRTLLRKFANTIIEAVKTRGIQWIQLHSSPNKHIYTIELVCHNRSELELLLMYKELHNYVSMQTRTKSTRKKNTLSKKTSPRWSWNYTDEGLKTINLELSETLTVYPNKICVQLFVFLTSATWKTELCVAIEAKITLGES